MGSLFGSLLATTGAMQVYQRGLNTVQNNILNANTAGYAKQKQIVDPLRFDPANGVIGGIAAGEIQNFRDRFSERAVWTQSSTNGRFSAESEILGRVEPLLEVGEGAGIPGAVNRFFDSVQQWTLAPNDIPSRRVVVDRASDMALQFRKTSDALLVEQGNIAAEATGSVAEINQIARDIAAVNATRRQNRSTAADPGTEAQLYASLEKLSTLANFSTIDNPDGSVAVYLGGQSLLVIGDQSYPVSMNRNTDGTLRLDTAAGEDISAQITGGALRAQMTQYNTNIPGFIGELNTLAENIAGQVNGQLAAGLDLDGAPGAPLFTLSSGDRAASTLDVASIAPRQLAAASTTALGGNGNVVSIFQLSRANIINGQTITAAYGSIASKAGRALQNARTSEETSSSLLNQARTFRQDAAGVSLDEEAAQMIQFQRAYEAAATLFKTLNELTETVLSLKR
jgi:flagellar hook-associated protein 1